MSYDDEDAYSVNGGEEPAPFSGNGNEMESEFVDEAFDRVAEPVTNEMIKEDRVEMNDEEGRAEVKKRKKRTKEEKAERKRRKKEKRERRKREKERRARESSQKRRRHQKRGEGESALEDEKNGEIHSEEDERPLKKKRRAEMTETEAAESVRVILDRMVAAADEDDEALGKKQPALSKLAMLDMVCIEISKPKWVHWFIREGVCHVLGRWLSPLPGGGLPNITIRSRLLKLIQKTPLYIEHLQGTNLGARLIAMWKSSEELEENRAVIRDIIQALMRPLVGVRWSHRAVDDGMDETLIPKAPGERGRNAVEASRRARIPINTGYSFKVQPKSNFKGMQSEGPRDSESTMARLNRMMTYKKTFGNRTSRRAQNVSVNKSVI